MFALQQKETTITGNYWRLNACLNTTATHGRSCGTNLVVFAIEEAEPRFETLTDGFIGLAPSSKQANTASSYNMLDQMVEHGMITKKQFGVHTRMRNSTEDPSQFRFGGYNEELFKSGHAQQWIKTVDNESWMIEIAKVGFTSFMAYNETIKALIDPGYPFIALPLDDFNEFKDKLSEIDETHPVECEALDWCFFQKPCVDIIPDMLDMTFTLPTEIANIGDTYRVPPRTYLYDEYEENSGKSFCHLGVIGQKQSDNEHVILGATFMEHFYVTYDATDPEQLRIGISYELNNVNDALRAEIIFASILLAIIVLVLSAIFTYMCVKREQRRKQHEAREYIKKQRMMCLDEDEEEVEEEKKSHEQKSKRPARGALDDDELETTDPNSFLKPSKGGALDDSDDDDDNRSLFMTENEKAIGSLL